MSAAISRRMPQITRSTALQRHKLHTNLNRWMLSSPRHLHSSHPLRYASSNPPAQSTILVESPSPDYLKEQEIYAEVLSSELAELQLTDRAAEQLRTISSREQNPDSALRISVESGGCHGYQYKMELAKTRSPDDYKFSHPNVRPSNLVVDAVSLPLLSGSTIDYATELIGSSFRILDNPHAKGSGCGCGVSWELKDE